MSIIGNPITLGGGKASGPVGRSDVNFYDYDGSIVASYTAADFASLSALPKNPTHDGLTAQGWNYTLSDAKAYVASYGKLDVGQMYITDDGKTRIYIRLEDGRLAPYLGIAINGTATVEWGDGQTSTVTGSDTTTVVNTQHTYAAAGDYVIAIAVSGSMVLMGNSFNGSQVLWRNSVVMADQNRVYQNAIQKAEIGANTSISNSAFRDCYSLTSVMILSHICNDTKRRNKHRQLCVRLLLLSHICNDTKRRNKHRRLCVLQLLLPHICNDTKRRNKHRQLCVLRLRISRICNDTEQRNKHRQLCVPKLRISRICNDTKRRNKHQQLCFPRLRISRICNDTKRRNKHQQLCVRLLLRTWLYQV